MRTRNLLVLFGESSALCLIAVLGLFVPCLVPASAEEGGSSFSSRIQGGVPDHQSAAVGVLFSEWRQEGVRAIRFCTGTLITPTVVLTAGHCVSEQKVDAFFLGEGVPVLAERVTQGLDPDDWGMERISVDDQIVFPTYEIERVCPSSAPDIGLVHLARPVETVTPAQLNFSIPQLGDICQVVGFGKHKNEAGEATRGQRRIGDDVIKEISSLSIQVDDLNAIADEGDSGGPLFCNGTLRGLCSCSHGNRFTGTFVFYSRVDTVADWINAVVEDWNR